MSGQPARDDRGRAPLSFDHRFREGEDGAHASLLLLHGTGGDEGSLIPYALEVAPSAGYLSPRGTRMGEGHRRFFDRLPGGGLDEEDVHRSAAELAGFVAEARAAYGMGRPIAMGFSNGANVAAAMLLHPGVLAGAILLRPMMPFAEAVVADIADVPVLMISGSEDPLVEVANARLLAGSLEASGALVEHQIMPAGHKLIPADFESMKVWLELHQVVS